MKGLIIFLIILPILVFLIFRKRKRPDINLPENYRDLLNEHVSFYRQLDDSAKVRFEDRIKDFLSYVRIHGVHTHANDLDKLLVAASAVIPTFGFDCIITTCAMCFSIPTGSTGIFRSTPTKEMYWAWLEPARCKE